MNQIQKYVKLSNQVTIPYIEKGNHRGIVLIMLHGIADSCRAFELILPYISEDIHIFALTLRGHGDASHPETGYSTKDFTEDLVMFMEELNIDRAVILGASSGGFPARYFAIKHPERTKGLILLGSPSTLSDKPPIQAIWDSTISKLSDPIDPKFVREFSQGIISSKVPQGFLEMMLKENLKVPSRVWKSVIKNIMEEKFPGRIDEIKAPTLIIWGDNDTVVTREDINSIIHLIKHSKLIVHSNVGHLLYWEDPELIAKDIVIFMRELSRSNN